MLAPALFAIAGLVIYSVSSDANPRAREIGRIMFFAGLLAALMLSPDLFDIRVVHRP